MGKTSTHKSKERLPPKFPPSPRHPIGKPKVLVSQIQERVGSINVSVVEISHPLIDRKTDFPPTSPYPPKPQHPKEQKGCGSSLIEVEVISESMPCRCSSIC